MCFSNLLFSCTKTNTLRCLQKIMNSSVQTAVNILNNTKFKTIFIWPITLNKTYINYDFSDHVQIKLTVLYSITSAQLILVTNCLSIPILFCHWAWQYDTIYITSKEKFAMCAGFSFCVEELLVVFGCCLLSRGFVSLIYSPFLFQF